MYNFFAFIGSIYNERRPPFAFEAFFFMPAALIQISQAFKFLDLARPGKRWRHTPAFWMINSYYPLVCLKFAFRVLYLISRDSNQCCVRCGSISCFSMEPLLKFHYLKRSEKDYNSSLTMVPGRNTKICCTGLEWTDRLCNWTTGYEIPFTFPVAAPARTGYSPYLGLRHFTRERTPPSGFIWSQFKQCFCIRSGWALHCMHGTIFIYNKLPQASFGSQFSVSNFFKLPTTLF